MVWQGLGMSVWPPGKREYPESLQMPVPVSSLYPRLTLLLKTFPCPAWGMNRSLTYSR